MKTKILTQITARMTEKNIGKSELSKAIGISRISLWRHLNGKTEIPLNVLIKICEVLELEIIVKS